MRDSTNRLFLGFAVTDAFVSREDDPIVFAGHSQPFRIFSILWKMIVVNLDVKASGPKNARHLMPSKLAIKKESQFFKRLRRD
jgi:hypothetical protein